MNSLAETLCASTFIGDDFRVIAPLRGGGMGFVYVVEQQSTGKKRALKLLTPSLAADPSVRARFIKEAKITASIESSHVVDVIAAGFDDRLGLPYLAMELLEGWDLSVVLRQLGRIPLGDVREVLVQAGHALRLAHQKGIVHRDLKPENIFLSKPRREDVPFTIKILDFGIAKLLSEHAPMGTQPVGTPGFMAPEQTEWQGQICPATDVWALGVVAFLMLTGKHFWHNAHGSCPSIIREIAVAPIPLASERAQEFGVAHLLPPGFDRWFARCVDRNVNERFSDAGVAVQAFTMLVPPTAPSGVLCSLLQTVPAAPAMAPRDEVPFGESLTCVRAPTLLPPEPLSWRATKVSRRDRSPSEMRWPRAKELPRPQRPSAAYVPNAWHKTVVWLVSCLALAFFLFGMYLKSHFFPSTRSMPSQPVGIFSRVELPSLGDRGGSMLLLSRGALAFLS